jgi:hypothetical protein
MSSVVTVWFIVGLIVAVLVYDMWVATNGTPGDTISEVVLGASVRYPALPLLVGFVLGHLFWPQALPSDTPRHATVAKRKYPAAAPSDNGVSGGVAPTTADRTAGAGRQSPWPGSLVEGAD